jgi:hypothetical protein
MVFPYIAISINFISSLVTGSTIDFFLFVLLAFGIPPISAVFWMILFTELMYKDKRKIILGIFLIYWIIFWIVFFYLLFTDINSLATDVWIGGLPTIGAFLQFTTLTQVVLLLVTTILFFRESHKSENKEVRLKGTLLLLGIIILVGSMIIFSITTNPISVVIFIIPALILLYGALAMPEFFKRNLIKEHE